MKKYKYTINQLFVRFLKQNKLYERYMINTLQAPLSWKKTYRGKFVDNIKTRFSWDQTKEGFKFWQDTYRKWLLTILQYLLEEHCLYETFKNETKLRKPLVEYYNYVLNDSRASEYVFDRLIKEFANKTKNKKDWLEFDNIWLEFIHKNLT